jgi:hypothetical protein|tara:strand:+ start:243 stop:368 length:126 start_codon:yes stop_codon:yes gene_type:complete
VHLSLLILVQFEHIDVVAILIEAMVRETRREQETPAGALSV